MRTMDAPATGCGRSGRILVARCAWFSAGIDTARIAGCSRQTKPRLGGAGFCLPACLPGYRLALTREARHPVNAPGLQFRGSRRTVPCLKWQRTREERKNLARRCLGTFHNRRRMSTSRRDACLEPTSVVAVFIYSPLLAAGLIAHVMDFLTFSTEPRAKSLITIKEPLVSRDETIGYR